MRLIDADEMIEILRKSHESHANNSREEALLDRDVRLIQEQAKYHPIEFPFVHVILKHPRFGECDAWLDKQRQLLFFDFITTEMASKYNWSWKEETDNVSSCDTV